MPEFQFVNIYLLVHLFKCSIVGLNPESIALLLSPTPLKDLVIGLTVFLRLALSMHYSCVSLPTDMAQRHAHSVSGSFSVVWKCYEDANINAFLEETEFKMASTKVEQIELGLEYTRKTKLRYTNLPLRVCRSLDLGRTEGFRVENR